MFIRAFFGVLIGLIIGALLLTPRADTPPEPTYLRFEEQ